MNESRILGAHKSDEKEEMLKRREGLPDPEAVGANLNDLNASVYMYNSPRTTGGIYLMYLCNALLD